MAKKRRVFLDQDDVTADYSTRAHELGIHPPLAKLEKGFYASLNPMPGAVAGVNELLRRGFEVWIATKPPTENPHAATEKVMWIHHYFPVLKRNWIITYDKGMLGDENDFLVDDRPHRANCLKFRGRFVHFGPGGEAANWSELLDLIGYPEFFDGKKGTHPNPRAIPPFKLLEFNTGYAAVLDSNGINYGTGEPGAVLFGSISHARQWARDLGLEVLARESVAAGDSRA